MCFIWLSTDLSSTVTWTANKIVYKASWVRLLTLNSGFGAEEFTILVSITKTIEKTISAIIAKYPKLTVLSLSVITQTCQNGSFYVFGLINRTQGIKQNHLNRSSKHLGTTAYKHEIKVLCCYIWIVSLNLSSLLIDHVGLIFDLRSMSKRLVWSIGDQKRNPRTQTESFKSEGLILKDQCLQNAR